MKIALVFHGQPRNLIKSSINIKSSLNILNEYETYAHFWWDKNSIGEKYKKHDCIKEDYIIEHNIDKILVETYYPQNYKLEKDSVYNIINEEYTTHIHWNEEYYQRLMSRLNSLKKSIELINKPYDWYILTRSDVNILNFIKDFTKLNPNNIYVSFAHLKNKYLHQDFMYIVPQKYINIFRDIYDNFNNLFIFGKTLKCLHHHIYWSSIAAEHTFEYQFLYHKIHDKLIKHPEILLTLNR